jgi:hypothetical protein
MSAVSLASVRKPSPFGGWRLGLSLLLEMFKLCRYFSGLFLLKPDHLVACFFESQNHRIQLGVNGCGVSKTLNEHHACYHDRRHRESEGDDVFVDSKTTVQTTMAASRE